MLCFILHITELIYVLNWWKLPGIFDFFLSVLTETLTPEQVTKHKGIFEMFDQYLKHISNT